MVFNYNKHKLAHSLYKPINSFLGKIIKWNEIYKTIVKMTHGLK